MADANTSKAPVIVWFDTDAYSDEGKITQESLKAILGDDMMVFNEEKECRRLFKRDNFKKRLVLIISGQLGKQFVPSIHHFSSVLSIYIYCRDQKTHKEWSQEYSKVKGVLTSLDELVSEILSDPEIN